MNFVPRTALGLGLIKIRCSRGVTHAAGRGDFNDRNTVNSEAAAVAATEHERRRAASAAMTE